MKNWTLALFALLLFACSSDESAQPTQQSAAETEPTAATAVSAAEQAAALYDEYFEENLKLNPIQATFIGDPRYNDQLPNFLGKDHRQSQLALDRGFLERLEAIDQDALDAQDRLSWEIFRLDLMDSIEGTDHPGFLVPINQFFSFPNFFAQLGSGKSAQPFKTAADYDNWLRRVEGFTVVIDQAIENMHEGVERGVVQPTVLMERVLPQLAAHVVEDPEESLFYGPIQNLPEDMDPADQERLTAAYHTAIQEQIVPTYAKLHAFIQDEYMQSTRDTVGIGALPGGEDWYAYLVRSRTTTLMTPGEVHQVGRDEVDRIHEEMRGVMKEVGFEGDLKAFFEFTKTDPQFYYSERDQLLQAYRDLRGTVDELTPKLFEVFPKADYEVRAVEEFRERSSSAASYQRAAPDGSRPGIFYVNTYDLSARPSWSVESLFLHEAAPGHHFQIAIQQELQGIPRFRRFGGFTAYIEGWGLYSETLGKELGIYTDPYQYFGALAAELWRAIRLVVDTGIHHQGWTRQQVLDYMYENAPVAEARAVSEAERFMAIPGQALAYKIGQLKIRELRNRAEQELGDQFDVRRFHTAVLKDGAMPLTLLERQIDEWIASEKAED